VHRADLGLAVLQRPGRRRGANAAHHPIYVAEAHVTAAAGMTHGRDALRAGDATRTPAPDATRAHRRHKARPAAVTLRAHGAKHSAPRSIERDRPRRAAATHADDLVRRVAVMHADDLVRRAAAMHVDDLVRRVAVMHADNAVRRRVATHADNTVRRRVAHAKDTQRRAETTRTLVVQLHAQAIDARDPKPTTAVWNMPVATSRSGMPAPRWSRRAAMPRTPAPSAQRLRTLFERSGLRLSDVQVQQFWAFHQLLRRRNSELDLTRLHAFDTMVLKHYVDCALVATLVDLPSPLLDLGSGAGFPGIPLKIVRPDVHVLLGEPRAKRVAFLEEAIRTLGLRGIEVVPQSIGARFDKPVRGVITRAVATIPNTLARIVPWLQTGARVMFMKGPGADAEVTEAQP
jgi:16S rRNA (guanine(527)-N(7))-methyltransferase RsmG